MIGKEGQGEGLEESAFRNEILKVEIRNPNGELLETLAEGEAISKANEIVVFAHGFGTDLHERGIYDQISQTIQKEGLATLRFSYSGFGKSEGTQQDKSLETMTSDLSSVLDFIEKQKKQDASVKIIGFSLGTAVVARTFSEEPLTKPDNIILINNTEFNFKGNFEAYFRANPKLLIDEDGVWHLPRTDGSTTYIGSEFWESIGNPQRQHDDMQKLAQNYNVTMVRAMNDDVADAGADLTDIPFSEVVELSGNHNYTRPEDRADFLKTLKQRFA